MRTTATGCIRSISMGARRHYDDIPKTVTGLVDDPFRSLAGELRRAGGFAKEHHAVQRVSLGVTFLRRRVKRKITSRATSIARWKGRPSSPRATRQPICPGGAARRLKRNRLVRRRASAAVVAAIAASCCNGNGGPLAVAPDGPSVAFAVLCCAPRGEWQRVGVSCDRFFLCKPALPFLPLFAHSRYILLDITMNFTEVSLRGREGALSQRLRKTPQHGPS